VGKRAFISSPVTYKDTLVAGDLTGSIQASTQVTVGTILATAFTKRIDPGYNMHLKSIEMHLMDNVYCKNGSIVGSVQMYWEARSDSVVPAAGIAAIASTAFVPITGTIEQSGGTLAAVNATYSGFVDVGSIPYTPIEIRLRATSLKDDDNLVNILSGSFVEVIGNVIPGV